jgi:hypothetical protein
VKNPSREEKEIPSWELEASSKLKALTTGNQTYPACSQCNLKLILRPLPKRLAVLSYYTAVCITGSQKCFLLPR